MSHVAFLVLAHTAPMQAGRLMRRLSVAGARTYVHVDAKTPLEPFLEAAPGDVLFLDDRVDVRWGLYGMVEATLRLVDVALAEDPARLYLLSGQDYPIKPMEEILSRLADSETEFINVAPMTADSVGKPLSRLTYRIDPLRWVNRKWARRFRLPARALNAMLPPRDLGAYLGDAKPYGGSSWWCLTADTMRRIRRLHADRPSLIALHTRGHCPDESLFQTSLMAVAADRPRAPQPTFVRWDNSRGPAESPTILTGRDADVLREAPHLFARKFDMSRHPEILDLLDGDGWTQSAA